MAFPHPAEPFAGSDVRGLLSYPVEITVYSLRPAHPQAAKLAHDWGLDAVILDTTTSRGILNGLLEAFRDPSVLASTLNAAIACYPSPINALKTLMLSPRAVEILAKLKQDPPDVVHVFWGHYPSLVSYLVQRHLDNVPTSLFLGAYDLAKQYPISKLVARRAQLLWTHAKANLPLLDSVGINSSRALVAHRGIDVAQFDTAPDMASKDERLLVYAGRLISSKRIDLVLDVFRRVLAKEPRAKLKILGAGPELAYWQQQARKLGVGPSVQFAGHVPHLEAIRVFREASYFLLMSDNDRLPNAVKEAMASACVVVVSDTPGINELVPDERYGIVIKRQNTEQAANNIIEMMSNPDARERMGLLARDWVLDNFDNRNTIAQYYRAFLGLSYTPTNTALPVTQPLPQPTGLGK